ncbi:hypothetical protein D3C77_619530 [compost metagenome]
MRHTGLGDGHGEGPQQGIGQRDSGAATQPLVEGGQRALYAQAAQQAAGQRTDDQRHYHVHPAQAEHQHDADRCNYRIHQELPSDHGDQ